MPTCSGCPCAGMEFACPAVARPAPGLCGRPEYAAALRRACLAERHPPGTDRTDRRANRPPAPPGSPGGVGPGIPAVALAGRRVRSAAVAYLLNAAGICGGVRVVIEHVNGLVDRGHNAVLVTADGSVPPAGWMDIRFPIVSLADAKASGLWRAAKILVATHWTTAGEVAAGHGDGRPRFYFVQSSEDRMCPESAEAVRVTYRVPGLRPLACNTWVKDRLESEFGHRDVPIVPQGVSAEFWPEPGPVRTDGRAAVLIEGHDGNPAKDLRTAHAVCAELRARGHAIEVWGISQVAEVKDRYPYDAFWHAPDAATMRRVYSDATILLKTSVFEGRPLAPPEAMACGLPVVATDCLGTDDFAGVAEVRPVGDVAALADACASVLLDPEKRSAMAAAGLERVADRLRWPGAIDALETLLGLPPTATLPRGSIGVLMPTRDRPHLIGRALRSLQAQTRADWRALVVVNGNRDPGGYAAALAPFLADPRIGRIEIPEEGIPQALNAGLAALPPTDYLAVLEDDDEWYPEFLDAVTLPLDRDPSLAMAYCDLEERGLDAPLTRPPAHGDYDNAIHRAGNWIAFPMMAWRRPAIEATGGFDPGTGGCCDWDAGLRCAAAGGVRRVRRKLAVHWWHRGVDGGDRNTCQDAEYMRPFADRILEKVRAGAYDRPVPAGKPSATTEPASPSIGRQALNFGKALIGRWKDGRPMLGDDAARARLAICRACVGPGGYYDPAEDRCQHVECGCFLEKTPIGTPGKTYWPEQACPIGKWGRATPPVAAPLKSG